MKKVDILIIYEHKTRELESCALIAAELERRGYKTKVIYNYGIAQRFVTEAKVVIVPHVYDGWHLEFYTRNLKQNNRCVISMQWEQVLCKKTENGAHNPTGEAMHAQHIAWGQAQVDRYIRNNIESNHIHETGSVPMDLLRPEFRKCFLSKDQVAHELKIDGTKEWVLFTSSFAYANKSDENIRIMAKKYGNHTIEFAKLSKESYEIIIKWLVHAAKEFPNKLFIYRKHPAESLSTKLIEIEKAIPNFKCIDDYSIRQWTLVSDRIYNWFSTSLADMYFAHKSCYVLRPVPIPDESDMSLLVGGDFITTYEEFSNSLKTAGYFFPIKDDKIKYYYNNSNSGKMAFEKIADLCEDMINNPDMGYDYHLPKKSFAKNFLKYMCDYFLYVYGKNFRTKEMTIKRLSQMPFLLSLASKLRMFNQELYGADKLFGEYHSRFVNTLNSLHTDE